MHGPKLDRHRTTDIRGSIMQAEADQFCKTGCTYLSHQINRCFAVQVRTFAQHLGHHIYSRLNHQITWNMLFTNAMEGIREMVVSHLKLNASWCFIRKKNVERTVENILSMVSLINDYIVLLVDKCSNKCTPKSVIKLPTPLQVNGSALNPSTPTPVHLNFSAKTLLFSDFAT